MEIGNRKPQIGNRQLAIGNMIPPNQYVPQCVTDRRPIIAWSLVVVGAFLFVALFVVAPLARANEFRWFAFFVYEAFSRICHQDPERSFYLAGYPLAVCARCTGLYVGFAAAVAFYPAMTSLKRTHTPERKWLFVAAAPLAIDFSLGFFGVWENSHTSRFLTGLLLGAASVFFIMPGLVQLSLYQRKSSSRTASQIELNAGHSKDQVTAAPSDYSAPLRRI